MLSPGDIVRIYPENVALLVDDISTVAYGTVRSAGRRLMIDVTPDESISEELSLPVAATNDQFTVVTAAERDAGTHRLVRRFVVARVENHWLHGQVRRADHSARTVQLTSRRGRLTVSQDAVQLVLPVVAALLWDTEWPAADDNAPREATGIATATLLRRHQNIWRRIRPRTDLETPSRDIAAILAGYDVPNVAGLGAVRLGICDPRSGLVLNPCVQHIVDFAFHADGGSTDPNLMELGESFCHDPTDTDAPPPLTFEDTNAGTAATTQRLLATNTELTSEPERIFFPPPRAGAGASMVDRFLDSMAARTAPTTTVTDEPELDSRNLPHPPPAVVQAVTYAANPGRGVIAPSVTEFASEFQREHRARSRAAATRTLSEYIEIAAGPQHSKSALRVSRAQAEVHWWITNAQFQAALPMEFIASVVGCEAIRFPPHPGTLAYLFDWRFGSGMLSIAHFFPLSKHLRSSWNDDARVSLSHFPGSLTPPKPRHSIASIDNIRAALHALLDYANAFGSTILVAVVEAALALALVLLDDNDDFPDSVTHVVLQWFNDRFAVFGAYLAAAANGNASVVTAIASFPGTFATEGPAYQKLFLKVLKHTPPIGNTEPGKGGKPHGGGKQKATPGRGAGGNRPQAPSNPIPPDVLAALPKDGPFPICLRNLSKLPCSNTVKDNACTGFDGRVRSHKVPLPLADVVRSYVTARWGGLRADMAL
ncbi:hypothetical protein SDRG_08099 [Saprolegnia diclina VS20]|uniref:Uncharacterized protein n=1 Tax=Saprolegnia diclina (strain VS20) TaxID=1156394 RepID=T0QHU6_SAPDV|nr:hypothetical protein SDRG_08099 [Saprolegnia diclina VS20]EQC34326.1 hypothetical protein SDRG_08099 [Saprolegnia diclina VS20]|eukprot:XP_008612188.1 hypothetical protein SDRG_08099 [Saprolegnia diclina VS20]